MQVKNNNIFLLELQNFDLVGDEARAKMMENWQKWRCSLSLLQVRGLLYILLAAWHIDGILLVGFAPLDFLLMRFALD